ncbi:MAG: hypothetical protein DLM56_03325 [Pseudonocardiales bacterium]|nr:MAG: hypothetical protein DLM56_03325 [Pseudonocardiales bacterium]
MQLAAQRRKHSNVDHYMCVKPTEGGTAARKWNVPVLQTLLDRGVTTLRDAAGADAGVQHALANGWIAGPEVLVSLVQLSTTGGIGDAWLPGLGQLDGAADPALPNSVFDGCDAARAAVRRMVRAGADWIKLAANGSMMQGGRALDVQMTANEMAAVVEEAARHGGRQVMVHAHSARAAEAAARAGARSIEHGVWLDADGGRGDGPSRVLACAHVVNHPVRPRGQPAGGSGGASQVGAVGDRCRRANRDGL